MAREFFDRGSPLDGINRTVRDSRVSPNSVRTAKNFRLPDGRLRRRKGQRPYQSDGVFRGSQLMRHTPFTFGTVRKTANNDPGTYGVTPLSYGYLRWHDDFQPKSTRDWTTEFLLTLGDDEDVLHLQRVRLSKNYYGSTASSAGAQRFLRTRRPA